MDELRDLGEAFLSVMRLILVWMILLSQLVVCLLNAMNIGFSFDFKDFLIISSRTVKVLLILGVSEVLRALQQKARYGRSE